MLEKFDNLEDRDILDPCLGAGNLLAATIIAGADPKRCYGIELDPEVMEIAKQRLGALGVPACNLKCGNALDDDAYKFGPEDKPVVHDQEAVYIDFSNPKSCIAMAMEFPATSTAIHKLDISHQSGRVLLQSFIDNAARNGVWTIFSEKTPLADGLKKAFIMELKALVHIAEEQRLNSYDDLLPFIDDGQEEKKAAEQKAEVKQVECTGINNIIGRTFEQLLAGNESMSARKVWRLWAEEAKQAYARYNAWKASKPRDEVKAVHVAYRQWKIDQEAKWCKYFNAKNPNDRRK